MSETKPTHIAESTMYPLIVVLFTCFIIGLFTVLNQQFQIPLQAAILPHHGNTVNSLATLLNFSWFLAYPLSEGIASIWLEKSGYKKTFIYAFLILIAGLIIYELAILINIYTPFHIFIFKDAISIGFFIFLLGSFVIGTSIAILQTVLFLFLTHRNTKISFSRYKNIIGYTTNAAGMAIAPLVVSIILFRGISLENIQSKDFLIPLAGIIVFMILVLLVIGNIKMPSVISMSDFSMHLPQNKGILKHIRLGTQATFFYFGAEVAVGANINMYAVNLGGDFAANATYMAAAYWGLFLIGRLTNYWIKGVSSKVMLQIASVSAAILLILAMWFSNPWILCGIGFFHSFMWTAIFSLAIKPLGIYNAKTSEILMIGVTGGGIIPLFQGITADLLHGVWQWTWILIVLCEAYIFFYATRRHYTQS